MGFQLSHFLGLQSPQSLTEHGESDSSFTYTVVGRLCFLGDAHQSPPFLHWPLSLVLKFQYALKATCWLLTEVYAVWVANKAPGWGGSRCKGLLRRKVHTLRQGHLSPFDRFHTGTRKPLTLLTAAPYLPEPSPYLALSFSSLEWHVGGTASENGGTVETSNLRKSVTGRGLSVGGAAWYLKMTDVWKLCASLTHTFFPPASVGQGMYTSQTYNPLSHIKIWTNVTDFQWAPAWFKMTAFLKYYQKG